MDALLEVKNLQKNYKGFSLKNVSFAIEPGYIMGLVGPNGAGKTTTIRLLLNLALRDGGEVRVFGMDPARDEEKIKQRLGFVLDECHFHDNLSVGEAGKVFAAFYKKWDGKLFKSRLARYKIPEWKPVKSLSSGMKTKFAIACALSHDAELLLLDEPTSGLDPFFRDEFLDTLREFIQDGKRSVLFSTHIISDLEKVADTVCMIHEGSIVFNEDRESLFSRYTSVKGSLSLLTPDFRNKLTGIKEYDYGFEAVSTDPGLKPGTNTPELQTYRPSLENIILHTVRGLRTAGRPGEL